MVQNITDSAGGACEAKISYRSPAAPERAGHCWGALVGRLQFVLHQKVDEYSPQPPRSDLPAPLWKRGIASTLDQQHFVMYSLYRWIHRGHKGMDEALFKCRSLPEYCCWPFPSLYDHRPPFDGYRQQDNAPCYKAHIVSNGKLVMSIWSKIWGMFPTSCW